MRQGEIVEACDAKDLGQAHDPYTRGLLAAVPRLDETRAELPVLERTS
jgi:peptide/nickel transport system ATP-binding protein